MHIKDELVLKLMLTLARDRRAMQGRVRSVGFMREYLTLPEQLGVHTLSQMSDDEIQELAQSVSIKPKSDAAHFHFYLNDVRYRLVQVEEKNAVVVHSLSIEEWLAVEKFADVETSIVEQITNNGKINLTTVDIEYVSKLVNYVLFIGTHKGPAIHQAEGLFIFEQAVNMNSWTIMTKEQAIAYILEHGYIVVKTKDGHIQLSLKFTLSI